MVSLIGHDQLAAHLDLISNRIVDPSVTRELRILPLDAKSALRAGRIEAALTEQGDSIDWADILIAAIAIENDEPILTKNAKHFGKVPGLQVETY